MDEERQRFLNEAEQLRLLKKARIREAPLSLRLSENRRIEVDNSSRAEHHYTAPLEEVSDDEYVIEIKDLGVMLLLDADFYESLQSIPEWVRAKVAKLRLDRVDANNRHALAVATASSSSGKRKADDDGSSTAAPPNCKRRMADGATSVVVQSHVDQGAARQNNLR